MYFLPDDSMVCPWDPSITLLGSKDMTRERLTAMDFAQVMVTNSDGGQEPRWIRVEHEPVALGPAAPAPLSMVKALTAVQASAAAADEGSPGAVAEPELPFPPASHDATPATPETAPTSSVTGIDPWGLPNPIRTTQ